MATIEVNGTALHVESAGRGPAVLFVHGMCGDADVWADQAERLADRYTVVRYDRRGHTRSARGDAPISSTLHAEDAAGLIQALELEPCLIVGSSGGAAIAVEVALRHGHVLRGAVFSEPPLFSLDPGGAGFARHEIVPRVEEAAATGGPAAAVDAFFPLVCPGLWSRIDEDRKDRYRANGAIGLADLRGPTLRVAPADLARLAVPALVLAGELSHPTLRAVARRLAGALPDARFVELAGSGHVTYAERPDDFAVALAAFAGEVDRRAAVASREATP